MHLNLVVWRLGENRWHAAFTESQNASVGGLTPKDAIVKLFDISEYPLDVHTIVTEIPESSSRLKFSVETRD